VNSDLGVTRGDKFWVGNTLYFVPISGWTPGIRYTLSLQGTIRSIDGREMRIEHFRSFFAISGNNPPLLESFSPLDGTSVSTNDFVLELKFTRSMDKPTVESAFTIDGITNNVFEWLNDDTILKVIPQRILTPWVFYRWNLRDSAKCIKGIPLPKTYTGYFLTNLDKTLPGVENVYPVLFVDGKWYPTGADIETGLGLGQGIAVVFNKPVDENALRSLRFEPSLTGRAEFLSEKSIVYIFTRDPEPGITYTLIVSGDTRDTEGLKILNELRIVFTPDIPLLEIDSIYINENTIFNDFSNLNNFIQIPINQTTGSFSFSINFSQIFDIEEKLSTPQRINITPLFPGTLAPVALQYVNWFSDNRLYMRWENLSSGSNGISNYYKLVIPGGRGGISSTTGVFMKEDIVIYMEAVNEI
jgi:hypothetical protein